MSDKQFLHLIGKVVDRYTDKQVTIMAIALFAMAIVLSAML